MKKKVEHPQWALAQKRLGTDAKGKPAVLDESTLRDFFFDLLEGRKEPRALDAKFSIADMAR